MDFTLPPDIQRFYEPFPREHAEIVQDCLERIGFRVIIDEGKSLEDGSMVGVLTFGWHEPAAQQWYIALRYESD